MAEPKKRLTSTRSGKRRMHLRLKTKKLAICPRCKNLTLPHHACRNCGFYKNADILKLEEKAKAKAERRKEGEEEEKENQNSKSDKKIENPASKESRKK